MPFPLLCIRPIAAKRSFKKFAALWDLLHRTHANSHRPLHKSTPCSNTALQRSKT